MRGTQGVGGGVSKEAAGALWTAESARGTGVEVTGQGASGTQVRKDGMEGNSGIHNIAEHSSSS